MDWLSKLDVLDRLQKLDTLEQWVYIALTASFILLAIYFIIRWQHSRVARGGDGSNEPFLIDMEKISRRDQYFLGEREPLHIGRVAPKDKKANALTIAQTTIGRKHAVIKKEDNAYWVVDLDSLNGTFVNDHPVSGKTRLESGDTIKFHRYKFRFVLPGTDPLPSDEATQLASNDEIEEATEIAANSEPEAGGTKPVTAPVEEPLPDSPSETLDILDESDLNEMHMAAGGDDNSDVSLDNFIDDETIAPGREP